METPPGEGGPRKTPMAQYFEPDPNLGDIEEQTDEWHRHGSDEPAPQTAHGMVSPRLITLVLVGSFILVLLHFPVLYWMFKIVRDMEVARQVEVDLGTNAEQTRVSAEARLHSTAWIDEQAGVVQVPIDVAIRETAQWYERNAPAAQGGGR